jgi:DNA-binding CsgD family transcriptional regulator
MDQRDTLLRLVPRVYAAPCSATGWQELLVDACEAFGGSGASFIAHNMARPATQVFVTARLDPEALRVYADHWSGQDPWAYSPAGRTLVSGQAVTGEQLIPHRDLAQTAFFNDFARHFAVTRCLAGMLDVDARALSCLSINRGERGAPFGPDDTALLQALMPHLQRALEIHRRLAEADVQLTARADALDRLSHGVLVLSATGRLLFANRAGEAILRARDGLTFEREALQAARPQDTTRLRAAIAAAASTTAGTGLSAGGVVTLGRPSGRRALILVVSPVAARALLLDIDPPAAVVFVTDPERAPLPDERVIREALGLTPAEARLSRLLAEGVALEQAAGRLGLTVHTARTRLKAIFEKTGCHRQAELVRLVLTTTAGAQL